MKTIDNGQLTMDNGRSKDAYLTHGYKPCTSPPAPLLRGEGERTLSQQQQRMVLTAPLNKGAKRTLSQQQQRITLTAPLSKGAKVALPSLMKGGVTIVTGDSRGQNRKDDYMYLPYNKKLKERASNLRNNMTEEERKMWYCYLRRHPLRFLRQKAIDNYIADFYCSKAKLVIEIDGSQHYTEDGLEYDEIRTKVLEAHELRVLRFTNLEIKNDFNNVCRAIENAIENPQSAAAKDGADSSLE